MKITSFDLSSHKVSENYDFHKAALNTLVSQVPLSPQSRHAAAVLVPPAPAKAVDSND